MTVSPCTYQEPPEPVCGVLTRRTYGTGPRCPDHTPAALAGREVPVPDPKRTAVALRTDSDRVGWRQPDSTRYGQATTDPLGRTGWNKTAHLPKHHDQTCDQRHGPRAACNTNLKDED